MTIKFNVIALAPLLGLVLACGKTNTTTSKTQSDTQENFDALLTNPEVIADASLLGPCDKIRRSKVFFIESTNKLVFCSPPSWKIITTKNIDGGNEMAASPIIDTKLEAPGKNCINGGSALSIGRDLNGNKILDASEITGKSYACSSDPFLVNVKEFGAKGNNVADDSTAIMNAFAQAKK
jgi:hypothetical protein